jgi:uncharacterized protein YmfQ (DUF2313 family)
VIRIAGQEYGTAQQLAQALGPDTTAEMIRNWRRRDGLMSHRVGTVIYSPLAAAAAIERQKRLSTRGRPRSLDVAPGRAA